MFIFTTEVSKCRHCVQDTHTLESSLVSFLGESEAKRIATIAASMKPEDKFHNEKIYLKCKEGLSDDR